VNHSFDDIRSRITEPPTWWDSNGTPRWGVFEPKQCPSIYAKEVVLVEVQCQSCAQSFHVEMHTDLTDLYCANTTLADRIRNKIVHYGDPPFHCDPSDPSYGCTGNSMNVYDVRVLEYWGRQGREWVRNRDLEIEIEGSPPPASLADYFDENAWVSFFAPNRDSDIPPKRGPGTCAECGVPLRGVLMHLRDSRGS
jgi:hypothetical protein